MQAHSNPKEFQLSVPLDNKFVRISQRDFGETDLITGAELCRNTEINCNHMRYLRITTNRLAITQ
jgi:hypothetical protein